MPRRTNIIAAGALVLGLLALLVGFLVAPSLWLNTADEVVVYTALDYDFSAPIFDEFTRQTGIVVRAKYDTEATKTVGLTQAILAEANRPRCDVFWNNEILNTLRLYEAGVLRPYQSPSGKSFPATFRDADGYWYGFAARARILLVNRDLVEVGAEPKTVAELADANWRDRAGVAKPLFGTTATHAACIFALRGEEEAREFFLALKANGVQVLAGNRQVAAAVASGQIAVGLTDTDDALVEIAAGSPVEIVYPDQGPNGLGTLFIPNTVTLMRGSPNTGNAERLVEYLLSKETESRLAQGSSGQIPLNPEVDVATKVARPAPEPAARDAVDRNSDSRFVLAMDVDFARAAALWDSTASFLREHFAAE